MSPRLSGITRFLLLLALAAATAFCFTHARQGKRWLAHYLAEERREHPSPTPTETPTPTPQATPTPSPTPIYVPQKRLETARLFNGMQLHSALETEPGTTTTAERDNAGSYSLELRLKVKIPRANKDMESLSKLNSHLSEVLPSLAELLQTARVSPSFEALFTRKLNGVQRNLTRLDQLPSRHNFFDCETILDLENPQTKRTAVLLQADMDVDMDGSDGDRLPAVDGSSSTFQPMTSYRWPKLSPLPNPFLAGRRNRLHAAESELALAKSRGLGESRMAALRDLVGAAKYEVNQLNSNSFLMAATDPYIVLPGTMMDGTNAAFTPHVGDYCVVIVDDVLYPAVVGDMGPNDKVGEASYRIAREINATSSADIRAVNTLKATYLVFPNSAEKPFSPPNLDHWRARVEALLKDFGGYGGKLFAWETLSRPAPLPTPTPTATPTPSPSPNGTPPATDGTSNSSAAPLGSGTAQPSPTGISSPSPSPSPSPASPAATPNVTASPSPIPSQSPSPSVIPATPSPGPGIPISADAAQNGAPLSAAHPKHARRQKKSSADS